MNERSRQRNAAFLLGLTTIMAGFFTWRAGQIGSDAAYADRSSIGQTITQEQQNIEVGMAAISDALVYVRYAGDYAEASALTDRAGLQDAADLPDLADETRRQADELRLAATARAGTSKVFGRQQLYESLATDSIEPLPFDLENQVVQLHAESTSGITSPQLDPDKWAAEADGIRDRIRKMRVAVLILLLAVAAFTIVQVSDRRWAQYTAGSVGIVILLSTFTVTVRTIW